VNQPRHMPQEYTTIRAAPALIGRREMLADIPERQRAEQRIAQGVDDHVTVRVSNNTMFVRYPHASQHHMIAGAESMHVVTLAYPH